ncbi:hypothetical protein BD410DRAFT_758089 [Rickenella mellea]|uniref:Zn(2)-C6 fungal-type domain-containing protein n=1 Tax=Rickenella mellea TaxID=50990 RepID=A0A4R5XGL8_9AGAM|nr:hypothetical protein BD410DRAFT_758089 [Rickenella mellea]
MGVKRPFSGRSPSLPSSHGSDVVWRVATPRHYEQLYSSPMPDQDSSHPSKKKRVEDQALPPDAGQKPVQLQRRRVWRACESCRRKKIKCDGNEPVCSQCTASRTQCTWLQTKDRAALSRHYVQELEARLLHMEDVFKQVAPVVELLGKTPNGVTLPAAIPAISDIAKDKVGSQSPATPSRTVTPKDKSNITQNSPTLSSASSGSGKKADDEVSDSFGQLALDEHGHLRWIGGSSTMALIQSFRQLTSSPLSRISPMEEDPHSPGPSVNKLYFPASIFFGKVHALPGAEEVEYPERDLADKLVDAYFTRLHYLLPVVDKPSFMNAYNHLMDNHADVGLARTQTAFVALVFAIFACAARIVDDDRLHEESSDEGGTGMVYYERALILHYISHASIQIAHVQCFVLLSSFLCSVNCLPQAWLLVGQAVRMGQDLGLHRLCGQLNITPIDKQVRRKVWWSVYSLDRMLALALGRPLGVQDSDCDAEMPVELDDDELPDYFAGAQMPPRKQPSLMVGFVALIELYKIAGQVCRQIYAIDKCKDNLEPEKMAELLGSVAILDRDLTQWCDLLPPAFKSSPSTEAQVSMGAVLCSHYYSILTTLHRNFLPIKQNTAVGSLSTAKALSSARACIRLAPSVKNVVPVSHHLAFFVQNLFSSAVILMLYSMHISDPKAAKAALDEAESCVEVVSAWEGRWPGARKCKELLSDLTATAHEAIVSGRNTAHQTDEPLRATSRSTSTSFQYTSPSQKSSSRPIKGKPSRSRTRRKSQSNPPRQSNVSSRSPYRDDTKFLIFLVADPHSNPSQKRSHGQLEQTQSFGSASMSFQGGFSPYAAQSSNSAQGPNAMPGLSFGGHTFDANHGDMLGSPVYDTPLSSSPTSHSVLNYNFEYPHSSTSGSSWNAADQSSAEFYASSSHDPAFSAHNFQSSTLPPLDPSYMGYNNSMSDGTMDLSDTPPSSSFAASGLPFPGLDYIKNYTPGGNIEDGQDALWQSFDAGEFRYDPDLHFSLGGEATPDGGR